MQRTFFSPTNQNEQLNVVSVLNVFRLRKIDNFNTHRDFEYHNLLNS